jgi:DNA-binding MarR family transcriptional regulator
MDSQRAARTEYVSSQLLPRAALLTRLLVAQMGGAVSRTEAGLLNTLSAGPRRVTELAELEGLAQPTVTLLVKRLEAEGLVRRERAHADGRVVMVVLTPAGEVALDGFRRRAGDVLGEYLQEVSDADIDALAAATDAVQHLVALLQRGPAGDRRERAA